MYSYYMYKFVILSGFLLLSFCMQMTEAGRGPEPQVQSWFDTDFGSEGFQNVRVSGRDQAFDIAVNTDGQIIVVGSTANVYGSPDGNSLGRSKGLLFRLNPDGSFDQSFGEDGIVIHEEDFAIRLKSVALRPDDRILVSGMAWFEEVSVDRPDQTNAVRGQTIFMQFLADGQLDASFGENGSVLFGEDKSLFLNTVLVQDDGKIIAAGSSGSPSTAGYVVRFHADGSPDQSFGENGTFRPDSDVMSYVDVLLQEGKILLIGYCEEKQLRLNRINSNATSDTTFADQGIYKGLHNMMPFSATLLPDAILVLGFSAESWSVIRLHSDGRLDTSFSNGILYGNELIPDEEMGPMRTNSMLFSTFHKESVVLMDDVLMMMRLHPDGRLDTNFGWDGFAPTDSPAAFGWFNVSAITKNQDSIIATGVMEYGGLDSDIFVTRLLP